MSDRDDFKGPVTKPHLDERRELEWWRTVVGARLPANVTVGSTLVGSRLAFVVEDRTTSILEELGEPPLVFARGAGNNEEAFWEAVYLAAVVQIVREGHGAAKVDLLAAAVADRAVLGKRERRGPR